MDGERPLDAARPRCDDDRVVGGDRDPALVEGDADEAVQGNGQLLAPWDLDSDDRRRGRGKRRVELVHALQQVAELEPPEHLLERRAVGLAANDLRRVEVELEVAPHRREQLRLPRLVGVQPQRFLALRPGDLVDVLQQILERAELGDQLPRGLVADSGDALDLVGGVALQPDEVGDAVGRDAVAKLDPFRRVDVDVRNAARRHHQADVLGDELERVPVGRDDAGLHSGCVRAGREGGDHVVGLPALELEVAVAEGLDDRPEVRELLAQEIGHRPAVSLVRLGDLGAVDGPRVPGDGDPTRPVVGQQLEQHVREAEERVGREAVARGQLLGKREEGPVGEVVAVDEEQLGVARRRIVQLELDPG